MHGDLGKKKVEDVGSPLLLLHLDILVSDSWLQTDPRSVWRTQGTCHPLRPTPRLFCRWVSWKDSQKIGGRCLDLSRVSEAWGLISSISSTTPVKKLVLLSEGQQSSHQLSTIPFFKRFQSLWKQFPGNPLSTLVFFGKDWGRNLHQFWFSGSTKDTHCAYNLGCLGVWTDTGRQPEKPQNHSWNAKSKWASLPC